MVQFAGKFEHVKNENLKEFIMGLGMEEVFANKANDVKATMEVAQNGEEITINTVYSTKTTTLKFTFGQEFDDPMPNGMNLKSVATLDGDKILVKSKLDGQESGYRTYEFSDSGVVVVMGAKMTPVVAKRHYKRL